MKAHVRQHRRSLAGVEVGQWKRYRRFAALHRRLFDLTVAYDDQDIVHTEPTHVEGVYLNTTVGRAVLNDHCPKTCRTSTVC